MDIAKFKELVNIFFEKLDINIESIEINNEENNIFYIKIQTPDSSLLIWYSWKNLDDLRIVLKNLLVKILKENIILHIEINDYLMQKDNKLFSFIQKKIDILNSTWKEIVLPFFNSYERKKIHSYVSELNNNKFYTKSVWEWKERRLHLCKKSENLTIDMDWVDI